MILPSRRHFCLWLALPALCGGCSTVVRENILSNLNSGVGLSLTENPQTQLYEIRAGYIRSQFYSIPTAKRVEGKGCPAAPGECACLRSNAANTTPQVVTGIRMKSGIEHLLIGMEVSESFAVGAHAVNSPAAVAMYISQAKTVGQAGAASRAAEALAAQKGLTRFRQTIASETAIMSAFDELSAKQQQRLFEWLDQEFPTESQSRLAEKNSAAEFENAFLPQLQTEEQRQKVLKQIVKLQGEP